MPRTIAPSRSLSFTRSSPAPRNRGTAGSVSGHERQDGDLVDDERQLVLRHPGADAASTPAITRISPTGSPSSSRSTRTCVAMP